jgi:hypothetical protein
LLLLLGLLLLLLLLLDVELGRGVEAMALRAGRGPRVGELRRVTWVGHVVEVEGAAEALLVVDGHGGHLRETFSRAANKRCSSTGTPHKNKKLSAICRGLHRDRLREGESGESGRGELV